MGFMSTSGHRAHWRYLIDAPHRLFFFGGVVALVVTMLWWITVLAGREGLIPAPPFALPPIYAHAWLMVYGIFPFFILGFLMTAFVRWINAPALSPRLYRPVAAAFFVGFALAAIGALFSIRVAAIGMTITVIAWLAGTAALALRMREVPATDTPHPPWALAVLLIGWLAASVSAWGAITRDWQILAIGPRLGIWAFLVPMVFIVAHRMLPFFAQGALPHYTAFRPGWAPGLAVALFLTHAVLMVGAQPEWLFLTDAPLAVLSGWLLWRWQPWRARGDALLWTLFASFAWLPIGLGLSAADSLSWAIAGENLFGRAPLHVLGIGLLTSMVLAMTTRVSRGHSGRALIMDRLSLGCFLILQLAVLARLVAELPGVTSMSNRWLLASAVLWLLAVVPWACRYGLIYWQPRVDGRPG